MLDTDTLDRYVKYIDSGALRKRVTIFKDWIYGESKNKVFYPGIRITN